MKYPSLIKAWESLKGNVDLAQRESGYQKDRTISAIKKLMPNVCFNFIIVHTKHRVIYANLNRGTQWKCRDCISNCWSNGLCIPTHTQFPNSTDWDSGQDCHFQSQVFALTYTSVILRKRVTTYAFINTPLPLALEWHRKLLFLKEVLRS